METSAQKKEEESEERGCESQSRAGASTSCETLFGNLVHAERGQWLRSEGTYRNKSVACLLRCLVLFFLVKLSMWVELVKGKINIKCVVFRIFEAERVQER